MENTMTALLSQYWPLVLFLAFGGFLVMRGASKRREANVARNTTGARQHGMNYAAPSGTADGAGVAQGAHRFNGTTRGIPWIAEVALLASEVDDGLVTRGRINVRYTRWTATGAGTGNGALLLMTLPEGVRPPPVEAGAGGLLGGLASKAAWAALQVYVRGHFGNARAGTLSLAPEHRLPLPPDDFGSMFTAFGDRAELLQRFSPSARDWLLKSREVPAAILWDAQGLTLSWQTAHVEPEEIAACAECGAVLAGLLGASRMVE